MKPYTDMDLQNTVTGMSADRNTFSVSLLQSEVNFSFFYISEQSLLYFKIQKTLHKVMFHKLFWPGSGSALKNQLDPDQHWEKSWIRIRKKWMRNHSPGAVAKPLNWLRPKCSGSAKLLLILVKISRAPHRATSTWCGYPPRCRRSPSSCNCPWRSQCSAAPGCPAQTSRRFTDWLIFFFF